MTPRLAIDGGTPVRAALLPYGRHAVDDSDVAAVVAALRSDWLTTGPEVDQLERAMCDRVGARHGVAVNSGTAALHTSMYALGVGPGDQVLVPAITFAATANCALFQGATPVFVDVDPETLLIDVEDLAGRLSARSRAVIAVDYAGQPCDYDALRALAAQHQLALVADACHALGAADRGRPVGSLADLSCFSLHPVKAITAGEGGLIATDSADRAQRMRVFRNHCIAQDFRQRERGGTWSYEIEDLGFNYRLSDLQCALARSQLQKLERWVARRQEIARRYDAAFADMEAVAPLCTRPGVEHAYHLYVVRLDLERLKVDRGEVFRALRAEGIGVNVHYQPVYLHAYYRHRLGCTPGLCPRAEAVYARILSLPIFPAMSDDDVDDVIAAITKVTEAYRA